MGLAVRLLVVGLLLAPAAIAGGEGAGDFVTRGRLRFDHPSEIGAAPLALLSLDTTGFSTLHLTALHADVCPSEWVLTEAGAADQFIRAPLDKEGYCYPTDRLQLDLLPTGDHEGWLGIYADEQSEAMFNFLGGAALDPHGGSTLATPDADDATTRSDPKAPEHPIFYAHTEENGFQGAGKGRALLTGNLTLKIRGPDVHVAGDRNATDFSTGDQVRQTSPATRERTIQWLTIQAEDATLILESTSTFRFLARELPRASWEGNLTFTPAAGSLRTVAGDYAATGASAYVDGRFTGALRPNPAFGGTAANLHIEGDVERTSLAFTRAPIPAGNGGASWMPLIGGALVALAGIGAGSAILARRRRLEADADVDDLTEMAAIKHRQGRPGVALRLIRTARKKAPGSARLALEEAETLRGLGMIPEALKAYREAAESSRTGDAALETARLMETLQHSPGEVLETLSRALTKTPALLHDIGEGEFARLHGLPGWQRLISQAEEAHGPRAKDEPRI